MPHNYVDVILPLPLNQTFTYSVPSTFEKHIEIGKRIIVQFGARKYYSAIVVNTRQLGDTEAKRFKEIYAVLDDIPVITRTQLKFWFWLADYYMCSIGEVMQMALPTALKLESQTKVVLNDSFNNFQSLNDKELAIIHFLSNKKEVFIQDILASIKHTHILQQLHSLAQKNAVYFKEAIEDSYSPRYEKYVRLTDIACDESFLNQIYEGLKRSPRQRKIIEAYFQLTDTIHSEIPVKAIKQKILLEVAQAPYSALKALIDKKVFEIYLRSSFDIDDALRQEVHLSSLTQAQIEAFTQIQNQFRHKNVVLLHGVSASGKTEIYMHLIDETLKLGKQVLYVLPEIALTYQIVRRLKQCFGNTVYVYHSRLSDQERMHIWKKLLSSTDSDCKVVIGVRSSIFLPFQQLGLIIIDEEHENTLKQFDSAPRYHARDAAIMLSTYYGAKVILGSATPSIESYFNAQQGKYGFVELNKRYTENTAPQIQLVNLLVAQKKGNIKSMFSDILLNAIENTLKHKQQIILFQNRRGFAPYIFCDSCRYIFRCRNCDVTLTYHKNPVALTCHYCGYTMNPPSTCPACGNRLLRIKGFGTEKIEEELAIFFPNALIARLDLDTIRKKQVYENTIQAFENRKIDILVGTQIITKGFDFNHVGLVGILDADSLLNYPDFRSSERSYQLMTQVSGRAGRRNIRGQVIIQTFMPDHPIIQQVIKNDYVGMYLQQIAERKQFNYPPFYKLIEIVVKNKNENLCQALAQKLFEQLATKTPLVYGPEKPIIARVKNYYLRKILIKVPQSGNLSELKKKIYHTITEVQHFHQSVRILIDVDP